jgi:prevent-host-death family protein
MQMTGIKELKNRLTYYLKQVRKGDQIIVTDRGQPVAILHSITQVEETSTVEAKLASLAARGLMRLPEKWNGLPRIKAVKAAGKPASQMIIEERR